MGRGKIIWFSLLLAAPVILFVAHHYFVHSTDLKPTGFTNEENVLYMSYAHQYLDQDKFTLTYSNPFDGDPSSPAIYFQPVNFLLAGLMKAGMDPGLCFSLFGILMTVCCIVLGIKIIQHLIPAGQSLPLISVLFTWGGGLTAIAGLAASSLMASHHTHVWLDGIYLADPANGWWGLNWGRTLFIPLEAYYHFLFLLNIYFILKQKWALAALAALFLSISHPFTGIEFLLIINAWLLIEKLWFRNKSVPGWFWVTIIFITALHVWYYLVYLNQFPEHKKLFSQYSEGWTYSLLVAIPAYILVALLAAVNFYFNRPLKRSLAMPHQRLFLGWAIIAFLLSKHEWFIKPMQPVHFTRGYVWAGLFLFSLPAISRLISNATKRPSGKWLLYAAILLLLSDNLLWTTNLLRSKNNVEWEGHISQDTKQALQYLGQNTSSNDLIVGNAALINYLANTYTHANSWVSHPYNTPNREERVMQAQRYLESGVKPAGWDNRRIIVVISKKNPVKLLPSLMTRNVFENNTYEILIP